MKLTPRMFNFFAFLGCVALLLVAYYFQYYRNMEPCLLCILQRWEFMLLGVVFLLAAIHNPKTWGRFFYGMLAMIIAILGVITAARQVWLQHQPPQAGDTCLPNLNFLIQTRPWHEVIGIMFHGGQDCAAILWQFLGLTMAEWVLLMFAGFFVAVFFMLIFVGKSSRD